MDTPRKSTRGRRNPRFHMLQVRLSPREKEMLEKLAAHESQTLSEWVRFVIRAEYRGVMPLPATGPDGSDGL